MDAAQQLSIARQLSQKSRELKDVGDSMLHWENSMKLGDLKRRAYNEQIDKRQTPPKDSSEVVYLRSVPDHMSNNSNKSATHRTVRALKCTKGRATSSTRRRIMPRP